MAKSDQTGNQGVNSREKNYAIVAKHFPKAIDVLADMMTNAKQESVRVSAANKIIDKVLPNLQAQSVTGEDGGPIRLEFNITKQLQKIYGDDTA